ncbi:hypothetical protein NEL67_25835 [Escherichia coli]|nr:hypothetical protein [Escherichia coli]
MSQQQMPFTEPKLLEKLTRVKVQMKAQVTALQALYGFGEDEAAFYIEALLCGDKVTFFGPLAYQARITFLPWESDAFLGVEGNNPVNRPTKNKGWWRWVEDFRPDDSIEPHRFLIDPMANVFDVQRMREAVKKARAEHTKLWPAWFKGFVPANPTSKKEPYITYDFERTGNKTPLILKRGRLVAYRSPHLVWRDYMKHRYGLENFLTAPFSILREMVGYDAEGNMVPTGFYHPLLNEVAERFPTSGKVKATYAKGNSGAGKKFATVVLEVDHLNHDQTDDRPRNVRWVDRTMQLVNVATCDKVRKRGLRNELHALWERRLASGEVEIHHLPAKSFR